MNKVLIIVLLVISMSFGMVNSETPTLNYDYPDIVENAVHQNSWNERRNQDFVPVTDEEKLELFWGWCYVPSGRGGSRITPECVDKIIEAHLQPIEDRLDILEELE